MDVVITVGSECEGDFKVEVLLLDRQDINVFEGVGIRDNRLGINRVNQWFPEGDLLDRRVVESIDIAPVYIPIRVETACE